MNIGTLMAAIILLPLAAAVAIPFAHQRPNLREAISLSAAAILFVLVIMLLLAAPEAYNERREWLAPLPGIPFAFRLEPLGAIFLGVASLLWIVNTIFSIGYMRGNDEPRQTRFYVCFAIAIGSTMAVALADNLLTLFFAYEVLTISTYPLVVHHKDEEAVRSGRTYLGILMGTSIFFLLFAIVLTWVEVGDINFRPGGVMAGRVSPTMGGVLLILFMYGIGKAALMPMHRWLPAAMVAPTPVSALLHAVAVVKAGVFAVVKIAAYTFGLKYLQTLPAAEIVLALAGVTILIASVVALRQDNLKLRLAYSTVSQLSYVILAAFILTPASMTGAAMHIAAHALGKITLFMAAGAIYTAAHKRLVSQLDGIGRQMPWTMAAFAVGALSMIGVPPMAGFLGKWYMLGGAFETANFFAIAVIVISTLLNAAYFLPVIHAAFLRPAAAGSADHGEAPTAIIIATTTTAALTLLLFFFPEVVMTFAEAVAPE